MVIETNVDNEDDKNNGSHNSDEDDDNDIKKYCQMEVQVLMFVSLVCLMFLSV